MTNFKKSFLAGLFSFITISILTLLTYKTVYGVFLLASFGSSMVLLYGYPESPFAQPKNVFFGHLITTAIGLIFLNFVPFPIYIIIPLAVGFGVINVVPLNVFPTLFVLVVHQSYVELGLLLSVDLGLNAFVTD